MKEWRNEGMKARRDEINFFPGKVSTGLFGL